MMELGQRQCGGRTGEVMGGSGGSVRVRGRRRGEMRRGGVGYLHEVNNKAGSAELCLVPVWRRLIETRTGDTKIFF